MKVNIWIKKEEVLSGNITKYYSTEPVSNLKDPDKYDTDYVQVSITRDEFVVLEDLEGETQNDSKKLTVPEINEMSWKKQKAPVPSKNWIVEQYNRNRLQQDWVEAKEDIPYIHERNPDTDEIRSRKIGDYTNEEKQTKVTVGLGERVYTKEKELKELMDEMKGKTGEDFPKWFYALTKNEQTKLASHYND